MPAMNLLTVLIFLPLVGVLALAFVPAEQKSLLRGVALLTSLATFGVALLVATGYDAKLSGWQFEAQAAWAPGLGFGYHVGLDGIALLLELLTAFLSPIVFLSSWKAIDGRVKLFTISLLALETAMLGTFAALDLVLFYVFWEAMLIPMYVLIGVFGSDNRIYATVKFFVFTFAGSVLMLIAILFLYTKTPAGSRTFDYVELMKVTLSASEQRWLFAAFAIAFAIKVPMFPLHTWLPDAHTEAPTAGSVILAGVLLKMGTFGFVRYALPLFPSAALEAQPIIGWLGVVGIVYGALMCMAQKDMKRLIAYSSVSHLGFVMLGLAALSPEAVTGAVYQMLNHGVSTGLLFLSIGFLYERRHTRAIEEYGGLAAVTPGIAAVFLIATLASVGLPTTNGFVGEFLILSGTFLSRAAHGEAMTIVAATGVILGAVYMLWLYQKVFFGPVKVPANAHLKDLSVREWVVALPLVVAIGYMGVMPGAFLDVLKTPVAALTQRLGGNGVVTPPRLFGTPPGGALRNGLGTFPQGTIRPFAPAPPPPPRKLEAAP